jgi:hypothetical protein
MATLLYVLFLVIRFVFQWAEVAAVICIIGFLIQLVTACLERCDRQ